MRVRPPFLVIFIIYFCSVGAQARPDLEGPSSVSTADSLQTYCSYTHKRKTFFKPCAGGNFCLHGVRGYIDCELYRELTGATSSTVAESAKGVSHTERVEEVSEKDLLESIPKFSPAKSGRKTIYIEDSAGEYCFHAVHGYMKCNEYLPLIQGDSKAVEEILQRDESRTEKGEDVGPDETESEQTTTSNTEDALNTDKVPADRTPTDPKHLACQPQNNLIKPVDVEVGSPFGNRLHPYCKTAKLKRRNKKFCRNPHKLHKGCDFAVAGGTPIRAAASGLVKCQKSKSGYGTNVTIVHGDELTTKYAHLKSYESKYCNKYVSAGAIIGYADSTGRSTGNHLHFEVRCKDQAYDPVPYFNFKSVEQEERPRTTHQ